MQGLLKKFLSNNKLCRRRSPLLCPNRCGICSRSPMRLAKLPPEELNEDVDASRLEAAAEKRVRGMDEEVADAELTKDRDLLEQWLEDKPDHPAHWIRGFLLSPDLAAHVTQPPEPPPRGPEMIFEAPAGLEGEERPVPIGPEGGQSHRVHHGD